MYHRIVEEFPDGMHDPHMFVKSETLEMHLEEISKYFGIVELEDLLRPESRNRSLCALTFDDGWLDNYEIAFPILQENKTPATVFLPVNDIGTTHQFWFEDLFYLANNLQSSESQDAFITHFREAVPDWNCESVYTKKILELSERLKNKEGPELNGIIQKAYKRLKIEPPSNKTLMDWAQVREMSQYRITFGSHGLQHDILTTLSSPMKKQIVFESLAKLRNEAGSSIPIFSYPNGDWDMETVNLLREAGYHGAVTTQIGYPGGNPFLLNRIGLSETSSNTKYLLWFQLFKAICAIRRGRSEYDYHPGPVAPLN